MAGRAKSGHLHCGAILRRSWRPNDENHPAEVWISEYGKLYAKYEYQEEIECFPDVFALIERELGQCKFDSAAMKTVEALDGKL